MKEARRWFNNLRKNKQKIWKWDYLDDHWQPLDHPNNLYPGLTVLVHAKSGGYDPNLGFTGRKPGKKDPPLEWQDGIRSNKDPHDADLGQDREDLSSPPEGAFVSIATHGREAAAEAGRLRQAWIWETWNPDWPGY